MDKELIVFLNEQAQSLEKSRVKAIKLNKIYSVVKPLRKLLKGILIVLAVINFIIPILLPATITIGIIYLLTLAMDDPKAVFESNLKDNFLPKIFEKTKPNLSYSSYGYNNKILKESEILNKGFFADTIEIEGEDYTKGKIENIDVEFFEIKFHKEVTNYTKTAGGCLLSLILIPIEIFKNIFDNDNQPDDVFAGVIKDINMFYSGFFMYADFNKNFTGKIMMIPKQNENLKDKVDEIFTPKSLTKINVENQNINDNYNIYASDVQTGYYVLSQNLIDRINILSVKENALPIISFIEGKIYFLIPWKKNLFKADLYTKIENENYFLNYIEEINSFEEIVKNLNIDRRIWSKA